MRGLLGFFRKCVRIDEKANLPEPTDDLHLFLPNGRYEAALNNLRIK